MLSCQVLRLWIGSLALTCLLLHGCGGGGGDGGGGGSNNPPVAPSVGTVSGVVSSTNGGTPLPDVTVASGTRSTRTAADGRYTLVDVPTGDPAVVSFTLAGHVKGIASVPLAKDGRVQASPRLVPIARTDTVDAAAGGAVAVAVFSNPGMSLKRSRSDVGRWSS